MYRDQIIVALIEKFQKLHPTYQEQMLLESLKRISSDLNLVDYANQMGIDTNKIAEGQGLPF